MNPNNPNNEKTGRPQEKATKPGAVPTTPAEQAVARLDQRIAEKQQQYQAATKPSTTAGATSAFDSVPRNSHNADATPSPPATMQAFEEFVLGSGTTTTTGSAMGNNHHNHMDNDDMRAKEEAVVQGRTTAAVVTGTPIMTDGDHKYYDDNGTTGSIIATANTATTKEDMELAESAPDATFASRNVGATTAAAGTGTGNFNNDVEYGVYEPNEDGLAVAMPVMEDDEDVFIPSAVEYDPDAKPPLHRNRRFRLYGFLAFFAIVAGAVGATIGVVLNNSDDDDADIHPREKLLIRETIERVVGKHNLQDPSSPYAKAVTWTLFDDPMQLTPLDDNFVQRYIMAYFYFATSADGEWLSCAPLNRTDAVLSTPQESSLEEENFCVYQLLQRTNPRTYNPVEGEGRWLSGLHECDWAGVACGELKEIRMIELRAQEMSGSFPEGIVHLPFLQVFSANFNFLTGTIPPELGQLKHLVNFEVQENELTGTIPEELYDLQSLIRLNLGQNNLGGTISTRIGNMPDIKGIFLYSNQFTGPIPTEIGELVTLTYLRLQRNQLTGPIPTEIGNMRGVTEIIMGQNDFTGSLPEEISQLSMLSTLILTRLPRLGGRFPDSFWNMPTIGLLDIRGCNMTGSIGEGVANMTTLVKLRLAMNRFTGSVPSGFINSLLFDELLIYGNNFTGPPPPELCANQGVTFLKTFVADCFGENPEFECPCCTSCCNADGYDCVDIP